MTPQSLYTIRYRVVDALSDALTVVNKTPNYGHWRSEPSGASLGHIDDFTLLSTDANALARVKYAIGNTGYTFVATASNQFLKSNTSDCIVYNPQGQPVASPYKCEHQHTKGGDEDASFVVEPVNGSTQTVNDDQPFNRRDFLEGWCGTESSPYSQCTASDIVNVKTDTLGPARVASDTLVNCSSSNASQSVATADAMGTTTTLGTKVEVSRAVFGLFNAKLEGIYQKAWTQTQTITKTTTINVAPGQYGWMDSAMYMQNVTGNFKMVLGNQTYLVPDVTVTAPEVGGTPSLPSANVLISRSAPIANEASVCAGKSGFDFLQRSPVSPVAGGLYTIGVASANQRVITAPGASRDTVNLELGQLGTGREQRWRFIEMPSDPGYYELQSDNNPRLCVDLSGSDGVSVLQYSCHGGINQLWAIQYDPDTKSYAIVNKLGKAMVNSGGGIASGTRVVGSDAVAASEWVFTRVD